MATAMQPHRAAATAAGSRRPFAATKVPLRTGMPQRASGPARRTIPPARALDIDWSDPETLIGASGVVLGLLVGLGAPYFYIKRTEQDEARLEELRAMNRAHYEKTGEYLTEDEIAQFRKPKWTDRREWADDD